MRAGAVTKAKSLKRALHQASRISLELFGTRLASGYSLHPALCKRHAFELLLERRKSWDSGLCAFTEFIP